MTNKEVVYDLGMINNWITTHTRSEFPVTLNKKPIATLSKKGCKNIFSKYANRYFHVDFDFSNLKLRSIDILPIETQVQQGLY